MVLPDRSHAGHLSLLVLKGQIRHQQRPGRDACVRALMRALIILRPSAEADRRCRSSPSIKAS
jgi:hypothetical protein